MDNGINIIFRKILLKHNCQVTVLKQTMERSIFLTALFTSLLLHLVHTFKNNDIEGYVKSQKMYNNMFQQNSVIKKNNEKNVCRTISVLQKIKRRGCISVTAVNNICLGQCHSYTAPRMFVKNVNLLHKIESQQCFPDNVKQKKILMFCPGRKKKIQTTRILFVTSCKCTKM